MKKEDIENRELKLLVTHVKISERNTIAFYDKSETYIKGDRVVLEMTFHDDSGWDIIDRREYTIMEDDIYIRYIYHNSNPSYWEYWRTAGVLY